MIVVSAGKRGGIVAQRAILTRQNGNMAYRQTCRAYSIVAGGAIVHDAAVIEHRGTKRAGNVADSTITAGRDMTGILAGCTDAMADDAYTPSLVPSELPQGRIARHADAVRGAA